MRVESLTRQRHVLQTVWPVRIVRIDDSSCWVVVVGKSSKISSSSSGIAKTSADFELLLSVIVKVVVMDVSFHMCVYIFIRVCGLHLLSSARTGLVPIFWSIEVYASNAGYEK